MIGSYPYKVGDQIRARVPGAVKGTATVLEVSDIYDARNSIMRQHLRVTAPLAVLGSVWIIEYPRGEL
jgi:hypothetical protein